jgi:hypothetical protein
MSAFRFLKPPNPGFGHNGASVAPVAFALANGLSVEILLELFYTAASTMYAPTKRLTCKLTFHKDDIDRLVDDKGDDAPRKKAEIEMHGCEDFRRRRCVEQEWNREQGFCGSK